MTTSARFAKPPFKISRMSHVRLSVRDLDASCAFYTELAGLVVSKVEGGVAYLRGVEEVCHHSLVLRQSSEPPACDSIGLRGGVVRGRGTAPAELGKKVW
jgi:catechol 2,3-dioxygenase